MTISEAEAALAEDYYDKLIVGDLDTLDIESNFRGPYDYIVCADVLEHLKNPERVVHSCKELLSAHGQLLISIPNAAYCGLVLELMQGDLRYRTEGLLDATHLRFYTRTSLLRFLQSLQWSVQQLQVIERALDDSEFQHSHADSVPPAVLRHLLAQPDALTYQFICGAQPLAATATDTTMQWLQPPAEGAHATFASNIYWADHGQYSETHKQVVRGHIGQSHQNLVFEIPAFAAEHPTVRWDPANRPGFLHLHHMHLRDQLGRLRWSWQAAQPLASGASHQIVWQAAPATAMGTELLLLDGDDPWMQLPIPAQTLRECLALGPAQLDIAVSWPMSADYALLAQRTTSLKADLARSDEEVLHWRAQHQAQQQHAQQLQALHGQQAEKIHALHLDIAALAGEIQRFQQSKAYRISRKLTSIKQQLQGQRPPQAPAPAPDIDSAAISAAAITTEAALPAHDPLPEATPQPHVALPDTEAVTTPALATSPKVRDAAVAVDIIIPVYRGLSDTQRCLHAVVDSLPLQQSACHVIVINDASPEPALSDWLRNFAAQNTAITLLENSSNLGFVGTVNLGMALHPQHDVLLLNSDTEVAHDWVDRLRQAAYRTTDTGSVTPLSNNATICSYPKFCASNELPAGWDTAGLDTLCAQHNPGQTVPIPTAVGFCMYIRRDCLIQTGNFDEAHFGKGYGEENDFCLRAQRNGWQHVLALDTFVRHTGGVSFGASKTPREQAAYALLQQLHPGYDALVQQHLRDDPAQAARQRIDLARLRHSHLPKVLMVMHNAGGGTQRHVQELAQHLQHQAISLTLVPLPDHKVRLQWLHPDEGYSQEFDWSQDSAQCIAVLREIGIGHIHYHHLLGLNPQLMQLPEQLHVPYDFTAHDYYSACPQIALTNPDGSYCGEQGVAQCRQCLQQRPAPTGESIEDWRLRHRLFLNQARHVFAPSNDCARRMQHYFPAAPIHCVPHLDITSTAQLPAPAGHAIAPRANLRVFVLGGVSANKGGNVLEAVALAAAQAQAPLEFHLIGYPHRQMPCQPTASLTIHGPYQDADLPRLLERFKPDLVWFPALWPETYSYTLSACLQAGLPVVAPDIGAFSERLSQRSWTWLRPWHTQPQQWLEFFMHLRSAHFLTGTAPLPAPCHAQPQFAPPGLHWRYDSDYLPTTSAHVCASADTDTAPTP